MSNFKFSQVGKAGKNLTQIGRDYIKIIQVNFQASNWVAVAALITPLVLSPWLGFEAVKWVGANAAPSPRYAKCLDEEQPMQGQVLGNTTICLGASGGRKYAFIRTLDTKKNGENAYGISQDVTDFSAHSEGLGFNTKGFKFIQEYRDKDRKVTQSSKCLYSLQEVWRFCDGDFNIEKENPNAFPTLTGNRDVVAWVGFDQFSTMQVHERNAAYEAKRTEEALARQKVYDNEPEHCQKFAKWTMEEWEGCVGDDGVVIHFNKNGDFVDENGKFRRHTFWTKSKS
jgi:hypothetical protein